MVFAAIAQAWAFSYKDFDYSSKESRRLLRNLGNVLNVKDVIKDA